MRNRCLLAGFLFLALLSPAWSFGFTAGPQIEEHFGSEYGSEYYKNGWRCRVVVMKDRHGHRFKIKRCDDRLSRHPKDGVIGRRLVDS